MQCVVFDVVPGGTAANAGFRVESPAPRCCPIAADKAVCGLPSARYSVITIVGTAGVLEKSLCGIFELFAHNGTAVLQVHDSLGHQTHQFHTHLRMLRNNIISLLAFRGMSSGTSLLLLIEFQSLQSLVLHAAIRYQKLRICLASLHGSRSSARAIAPRSSIG